MKSKPLPTGDEPPRGYESVAQLEDVTATEDAIKVHGSLLSHHSRGETIEIETLRKKALAPVETYLGLSEKPLDFTSETNIIAGISPSDKLLFHARHNKQLVGYAFVIIGWPKPGSWLIQHIIIDPDHRLKGIGTALLKKIEKYALESEIEATNIYAIPIQKSGIEFWRNHGYTKASEEHLVRFSNLDHELMIYSKAV